MAKKRLPKYDESFEPDLARHIDIKPVKWRTENQRKAFETIEKNLVTFLVGEAGTSKTFLSIFSALDAYNKGFVDKIILTRPAVEASNSLGYLPGSALEKVQIYMLPMIDQLNFLLGRDGFEELTKAGALEILAVNYARGRNFHNTFLVIDEGQNLDPLELKMLLTRLGDNSKAIVNMDCTQIDLPEGQPSAADKQELKRFENRENISVFRFTRSDIVRSKVCKIVIDCYDNVDKNTSMNYNKENAVYTTGNY